ncbi:TetR/AcrR family transcriptional regulator [Rhodococcus jostii]|uniref:TetR/AcrR family transcriptional regulator n=1 Tax=Rhodococcus jostii TaxID=132919 RepID=UPI00364F9932
MSKDPVALESVRRRPRDRKQQIVRAARDLFVEHGYPQVSMAAIAESVGVTAGALYRHVETKSELLTLVFADSFAWLDETSSSVSFDAAIERAITRVADEPYLPDLWVSEARFLDAAEQATLRRRMRANTQQLVVLLTDRRPDLDANGQDLIAWALQSLISSAGRRSIRTAPSARTAVVRRAVRAVVEVDVEQTSGAPRTERLFDSVSRRERLLRSAFDEFERVGYHETSMASIAAVAGVSGPNLYGYFESKAEVLRAVYDRSLHALWIAFDNAMLRAEDAEEALDILVNDYAHLSRHWPRTLEEPSGDADLDEWALTAQREYVSEWVALLRRVRPRLTQPQARLRVQIGLLLIADLYRIPHLRNVPSIETNGARLVRAVLFS